MLRGNLLAVSISAGFMAIKAMITGPDQLNWLSHLAVTWRSRPACSWYTCSRPAQFDGDQTSLLQDPLRLR